MAMQEQMRVPLTNGHGSIPTIGCGSWTMYGRFASPDQVVIATKAAIDAGLRHFDCGWNYGTEMYVGASIKEKINAGVVKRDELFITTKLWNTHHNPNMVTTALQDSLKKLQTDYVDMYLIHYPTALQDSDLSLDNVFPRDKDGNVIFVTRYRLEDVWKAMEGCVEAGLARNIGLSNFNTKQVQRIFNSCSIKPANAQIEISPYHANQRLRDFCKEKGMVVTGYAPFGGPDIRWKETGEGGPFMEPILMDIAAETGKTVAQVILRYHIQCGVCVIPKSTTPSRWRENIDVFDFELTFDQMTRISSLNRNFRVYKLPMTAGHPEYPFNEPY